MATNTASKGCMHDSGNDKLNVLKYWNKDQVYAKHNLEMICWFGQPRTTDLILDTVHRIHVGSAPHKTTLTWNSHWPGMTSALIPLIRIPAYLSRHIKYPTLVFIQVPTSQDPSEYLQPAVHHSNWHWNCKAVSVSSYHLTEQGIIPNILTCSHYTKDYAVPWSMNSCQHVDGMC